MSADEALMPPPSAVGSDKGKLPAPSPAPKPAATFTSFINKNTTGKKFAPKAARRRPAVALSQTPTPETSSVPAVSVPVRQEAHADEEVATHHQPVQPAPALASSSASAPESVSGSVPESVPESVPTPALVPALPPAPSPLPSDASVAQFNGDTASPPPPRRRRQLPWVAINHPQYDDDEENDNNHATETDADEVEHQPPTQLSAKARGKRKAATADTENDADAPPPKRTRRPRIAKGKTATETSDVANSEHEVATRRKPRRTKKRRQTTEADDQDAQPKPKGRPPRESTPSDAEEHTIDPETTFMDGLASRNIRVGKLSNREKQMRQIDWVAVRQRRREQDARPIRSKEEQEAADKLLAEAGADLAAQQELGPRYHLVDGQIQVVPNSGNVNREADAQREIAEYEVIEDGDITSHITLRSFMKNNKRFPNDFLLPGQGKRWNRESTDLFYQGLRSFGTDFQMISLMFPGSTRRSIKTKFTREERENPVYVREALQGRSEMASHWPEFLKAAQMEEENFADADEIKKQMAEDEARMRELIATAKEETRQRNLQKVAAGMLDDENEVPQPGNEENENVRENRRKKKGKEKQVVFQEEEGVEIVGSIDD